MSVIRDALNAMKEVMLLSNKVDDVGSMLSELSGEVRNHENRLIRMETIIEVAQYNNNQQRLD